MCTLVLRPVQRHATQVQLARACGVHAAEPGGLLGRTTQADMPICALAAVQAYKSCPATPATPATTTKLPGACSYVPHCQHNLSIHFYNLRYNLHSHTMTTPATTHLAPGHQQGLQQPPLPPQADVVPGS